VKAEVTDNQTLRCAEPDISKEVLASMKMYKTKKKKILQKINNGVAVCQMIKTFYYSDTQQDHCL